MNIQPPSDDTVEHLHNHTIADPYRPLEDIDAPETLAWAQDQTEKTEAQVFNSATVRAYVEEMREVINFPSSSLSSRYGQRKVFYTNSGLQQHYVLMLQEEGQEPTVLLDPNTWPVEQALALVGAAFSPDGKYLAYQISEKGEDWTKLYLMDVDTRQIIADNFRPCLFSSVSWKPDSKSFVYSLPTASREDIKDGKNPYVNILEHRIGTNPADDTIYFAPPASAHRFDKEHLSCSVHIDVATGNEFVIYFWGTNPEHALYWRNTAGDLVELLGPDTATLAIEPGRDGYFYGTTTLDSPRGRVVRIDPAKPQSEHWLTLVPQHERDVLSGTMLVGDKMLVSWKRDVAEFIAVYDKAGQFIHQLDLPAMVNAGAHLELWSNRWAYIYVTSYQSPDIRYVYDSDISVLTFHSKSKIARDLTGDSIVVEQAFVTSKDGTKVPMTIIYDKNKVTRDGTAATRMYGYGGFNHELSPSFSNGIMNWVEKGGVYVVTNIRGGGEYGREWHLAATKQNKQKSYDDFIACAEYLIDNNYTMPERLGINGGSNGGLLVLACALQHPDLFGAVLADVPVTDLLRFHTATSGGYWVSDYGDPDDANDFESLLAISPLHNIKGNKDYPIILVSTGDHDDRVEPWHSYKFVASMHQHNPDALCYLHVDSDAGHGGGVGLNKQLEHAGKMFSFWEFSLGPINQAEFKLWKTRNPSAAVRHFPDGKQSDPGILEP